MKERIIIPRGNKMKESNIVFKYIIFNLSEDFEFHPEIYSFGNRYKLTLGSDVYRTIYHVKNYEIKVLFWDIALSERLKHIRTTYYDGVSRILIFSSLSSHSDFDEIENLIHEIYYHQGPIPILIFKIKDPSKLSDEPYFKRLENDTISIFKIEGDSNEFIERQIKNSIKKLLQDR